MDFRMLLSNKPYLFLILSNTFLYMIDSGIQFWTTFYIVNVVKLEKEQAHILFASAVFTAPIFSAIATNVLSSVFGSFESNKILPCCFILAVIEAISNSIMPEMNEGMVVIGQIWVLMFLSTILLAM